MSTNKNIRHIPFLIALAIAVLGIHATAATLNVPADHTTIQAAINAATPGDTVQVAAGTYAEQITLNKALILQGANAGVPFGSRGSESIIAPAGGIPVSITADGVTFAGFEITAPAATNAIVSSNVGNLTIRHNWIHDVGTTVTNANVHAIIYTLGNSPAAPASVTVSDNLIEDIASSGLSGFSASAIGILQSTSTGILDGLSIERNAISNVAVNSGNWPTGKIAYGVVVNVAGGSGFASSTGKVSNVSIADNTISNLSGFIATGIGLEGNTDGALVEGNVVSSLSGRKSSNQAGGGLDLSALKIEKNRFAGTVVVTGNSFRVETFLHDGNPGLGYAISSYEDASLYGAPTANLNWLGAAGFSTILGDGITTGKVFAKSGASVVFNTWYAEASLTTLASSLPVENVTQNTFFATIQAAINASVAGDTVLVEPGVFAESVTIGKQLILRGNNHGVAAGGARGAESQISGAILVASGGVEISGFEVTGATAQIRGDGAGPYSDVRILHNYIHNSSTGQAILYGFGSPSTTIGAENWNVSENTIEEILASNSTGMVLFNITGLTVENNTIIHTNTLYAGRRGINLDGVIDALISGNSLDLGGVSPTGTTGTPWAMQLSMSDRAMSGIEISGNLIQNSYFGIVGLSQRSLSDVEIAGNTISGVALGLALNSGSTAPVASGTSISNVNFLGNTVTASIQALRIRNLHSAHANGPISYENVIANQNVFLSGGVRVEDSTIITEINIDASKNYWGLSNPDFNLLALGTVVTSPWYADEARTILVTAANFLDVTIPAGSSVTETDLYIGSGATYTVLGSLAVTGVLTLTDGAVLEVINGSLTINGSTLSGTFTFFNSLGSVTFNDDVAITGSAEGLILVTDVHVADGATITVDGNLVIDGSVLDCQTAGGAYTLEVNSGASFTMARTVMIDGQLLLGANGAKVYDNSFESSTLEVNAGATGVRVYHNLTDDLLGWLTDGGIGTVTTVDGWGNVDDTVDTENRLALDLDISLLLATDRTQDIGGNVYVQPGDVVTSSLDVSALQAPIAAVEVMLGYNTGLLGTTGLVANTAWDAVLVSNFDSSNMIGLIDSALGYTLTIENPSAGSSANQTIATVSLTAGLTEGETLFFHRVKLASDTFGGETRLTTGGNTPAFLTPFTTNSAMITIDGTDPLIADPATESSITQFGDNMTLVSAVTVQGDVEISASAFDALAGIDDVDAVVTLVGATTYTATQTASAAGPTIGGDDYTTYTYTYTVDELTENDTYDVVFTVTDRSGNRTVETLGTIVINKNQVNLDIELQGLAAGSVTRSVVLVFTDSAGALIETRTESIAFTNGVGSVTLTDVDGDSFRLSAKTAWNLRNRLQIGLDGDGQADLAFTGTERIRGGDINGDNVINTLDYSILRFNWFTANAVADISGDGVVRLPDYSILQGNFYAAGTPQ